MQKLLIATTNPAKLAEIKYFLKNLPLTLLSLNDVRVENEPVEDGTTFEENAVKKAKFYQEKTGLAVIADDGGIEIDFFNGEPGVKSKRWIKGQPTSDEELIKYTLEKMKSLPRAKREAQLRTIVALALPNGKVITEEGKVRGIIAQKSGPYAKGYPYRALFYIPEINKYYDHTTMTKSEYKKYGHRAKAVKKLAKVIKSELL